MSTPEQEPINLSDLAPVGLPFDDTLPGGDGQRYYLRPLDDFSPLDLARLRQLQQQTDGTYGKANAGDEAAARVIEGGVDALIALIAPDWPAARVAAIGYGVKTRLIARWEAAQPRPPLAAQKQTARASTARAKRSRGSAPPTASAPAT